MVAVGEFQRALGRIEGSQAQILNELKMLQDKLGDHINADQVALSEMRTRTTTQAQEMTIQLEHSTRERNKRLDQQDLQLQEIARYINWAKGVSYPILGLFGLVSMIMVGILVASIQTWLRLDKL